MVASPTSLSAGSFAGASHVSTHMLVMMRLLSSLLCRFELHGSVHCCRYFSCLSTKYMCAVVPAVKSTLSF